MARSKLTVGDLINTLAPGDRLPSNLPPRPVMFSDVMRGDVKSRDVNLEIKRLAYRPKFKVKKIKKKTGDINIIKRMMKK